MESMKETDYYKSGQHLENVTKAREKALVSSQIKKLEKINQYTLNPNLCCFCDNPLPYKRKRKKFCNSSCAAKSHNAGRVLSVETKQKISKALADYRQTEECKVKQADILKTRKRSIKTNIITLVKIQPLRPPLMQPKRWFEITCIICGHTAKVKPSQKHKKTCSKECQITAAISNRTYQNGKKKLIKYYNKWINKEVNLESSWELIIAQLLDDLNIKWYRPKAMKWIDQNNKNRLYFCDFFLPDHNTYLDPKNPYCMDKDHIKIQFFQNKINLIVGDINLITTHIQKYKTVE